MTQKNTPTTTAIATSAEQISEIEKVALDCSITSLANAGHFERTLKLANGVKRLRELFTPEIMGQIIPLQDTSLGFHTDRNPKTKDKDGKYHIPYSPDVVKEIAIEAMIRGFYITGNEINIIAGRLYVPVNGLARKVKEFPGLKNLVLTPQVPRMRDGGAVVTYGATWTVNAVPASITREIPVRVNANMGTDAIIGKAKRKIYAAIYEQLTGSANEIGDGDVDDLPNVKAVEATVIDPVAPTGGAAAGASDLGSMLDDLPDDAPIEGEKPVSDAAPAAPVIDPAIAPVAEVRSAAREQIDALLDAEIIDDAKPQSATTIAPPAGAVASAPAGAPAGNAAPVAPVAAAAKKPEENPAAPPDLANYSSFLGEMMRLAPEAMRNSTAIKALMKAWALGLPGKPRPEKTSLQDRQSAVAAATAKLFDFKTGIIAAG